MDLRACPGCRADVPRVLASIDAAAVARNNATYREDALAVLGQPPDRRFDLVQCTLCGFVYAHELPAFLSRLYGEAIDRDAAAQAARSTGWLAHQLEITGRLLARSPVQHGLRFLDYGCGDGSVVKALTAIGIDATGFDPYSTELPETPAFTRTAAELERRGPFDAVLLSDVLEHLPEPAEVLAACHGMLASGGWICVSVPDFSPRRLSAVLRDLASGRAVTKELNPWEHLNYFTPRSLSAMLERAGFAPDFEPAPAFGFRSSSRGLRRAGNAARTILRLGSFVFRPHAGTTTVYARKR